jgi:hypothetical protein
MLVVLPRWEKLSRRFRHLSKIPGSRLGVLRFRLRPFRGAAVVLPDGTRVEPGELVAELHCDNSVIFDLVKRDQNPYRATRADLRLLAAWLDFSDPMGRIRAFRGVTMLGPAAARLGCFVLDRPPGFKARIDRWYMIGLLLIYTTGGMERLNRGTSLRTHPREVWLTRHELMRRYGSAAARRRELQAGRSLPGDSKILETTSKPAEPAA